MSQIVSSSALKRHLGAWLDWTGRNGEELVIETYGRPVAVLVAYEEYADYLAYRRARAGEAATGESRRRLPPPFTHAGATGLAVVGGNSTPAAFPPEPKARTTAGA